MSRKTSSAIDFATYGLEDARRGLNGTTETIPLMTEEARPVAKQTKQTVDWQHAAEKISCGLSLICLGAACGWRSTIGNNLLVRVSRETLLFSNNATVEDGMRLLHSTWNNHCENKFPMLLQRPMWDDDIQVTDKGLVMHSSIYAFNIYIFPLTFFVFFFSIVFQGWRWFEYGKLYKPAKGPDFSRWLEYFFTSPLQILIVSSSFGFATADALIGQAGMQAALVLLGYDIEQQVKKIYKRREQKKSKAQNYVGKHERFQHLLTRYGIADLRLWVYLFFAWALHIAIWGIPTLTGFGIGGKYYQLKQQLETCVKIMEIPDAVTVIYWLQFVLFTLFGLVGTAHVFIAKTEDILQPTRDWKRISGLYTILSVTAKTALEIGLVSYVYMYKEWIYIPEAHTQQNHIFNPTKLTNETCWTIIPPVLNE
jgi:hypothetical protein